MEELKVGDIIKERYELIRFLGSGSFGEVWLARDLLTGRDVALKIYLSLDPAGVDEFKLEYTNTIDLSDRHLLTPDYFDVYNRRPFLVMKYCENGSSSKLVGNISEEQLWRFIQDVASGLNVLHNQSEPIIHQDIKPDNILVDRAGQFLITDFGISKRLRATMRRQSKRDVSSGAMPYMAPERFDSTPSLTPASDIWSLGASIYELATGELPFSGFGGAMQRNGADLPLLNEKFSPDLNEVMQHCLKLKVNERPCAVELVKWAKDRKIQSNLPISNKRDSQQRATVSEVIKPTSAVNKSSKSSWIYIVTAVVLITGAFFFWHYLNTDTDGNSNTKVLQENSVVEEVSIATGLSAEQQVLNSKSTVINGQTVHFYKGAFYYGDDIYPVMLGFIASNGHIQSAIYKNITYGGRIALSCHSMNDTIRLSGKDGNNDFTMILSGGEDNRLLGTATDGNKNMTVRLMPTSESFEFVKIKKTDVKYYSFKVGDGEISIPSFLTKDGETNGGGSIFTDSTKQIKLTVQKCWDTDLSIHVAVQHGLYGRGTMLLSRENCVVESGTTRDNKIYYWKAYLDTNASIPVLYTAQVIYPISRRDEMDGLLAKMFNPFPNIK